MGSKSCAHSWEQIEGQRVTSWWPVALMGVILRSAEKWSKTKTTEMRNRHGAPLGKSSFQLILTIFKTCSNKVRLWSRLKKSITVDALCTRDTKRRDIPPYLGLLCLFVSSSVEFSPSPKSTTGTSAGPEKQQRPNWRNSCLMQG